MGAAPLQRGVSLVGPLPLAGLRCSAVGVGRLWGRRPWTPRGCEAGRERSPPSFPSADSRAQVLLVNVSLKSKRRGRLHPRRPADTSLRPHPGRRGHPCSLRSHRAAFRGPGPPRWAELGRALPVTGDCTAGAAEVSRAGPGTPPAGCLLLRTGEALGPAPQRLPGSLGSWAEGGDGAPLASGPAGGYSVAATPQSPGGRACHSAGRCSGRFRSAP